ncbi:MAG: kynureninase [Cyclobacteriaceae bacterium]
MNYQDSLAFAEGADQNDPLRSLRSEYHIPQKNGKDTIYFCGNSLGLQPKVTQSYVDEQMQVWKNKGVEGHFDGQDPWVSFHRKFKSPLAKMVGAKELEVTCMNNLTTNLHLLLASFYQPTGKRNKVIIEGGAFPSDHYAVQSHMRHLGIDPYENLIVIHPEKEETFSKSEILENIKNVGDELALVLWPGIQYYTGQYFDLKGIAEAAHKVGAYAGFDLAHAMGNLPMRLHDWNADFATWCSYKYVNSGPGGISGIYIHERHCSNPEFHKLTGWWGHDLSTRFDMDNEFVPSPGVDAWMLSNSNIISAAAHLAALSIFEKTTMSALREKSIKLTGYLEYLLTRDETINKSIKILTPNDPEERGCQLSMYINEGGKEIFDGLMNEGVILDWREPNVIRVAPTPMYNTFSDVFHFYQILKRLIVQNG